MRGANLPLDGVTVVALEQAVAAPFATRQLAALGARVIKIERPGVGDFARGYDATVKGMASHFVWLNRSKQSLTLNLKEDGAKDVLNRLLARADVFVHNLAPGATERLGFGAERLREEHPRLIDVGISAADIAAGMYAYSGILTALYMRERTGEGAAFEVSLLEALGEWMGFPAYFTGYGGSQPPRTGASHAAIAPYGPFEAGDGRVVFLGLQNEREWVKFCEAVLERPELATDPRFDTNSRRVENGEELDEAIDGAFKDLSSEEVISRLDGARIANARVRP